MSQIQLQVKEVEECHKAPFYTMTLWSVRTLLQFTIIPFRHRRPR